MRALGGLTIVPVKVLPLNVIGNGLATTFLRNGLVVVRGVLRQLKSFMVFLRFVCKYSSGFLVCIALPSSHAPWPGLWFGILKAVAVVALPAALLAALKFRAVLFVR